MSKRAVVSLVVVLTAGVVAGPVGAAARQTTIAAASTPDYRVVVGAQRLAGGGGAPTASVTLTSYRRASAGWARIGSRRVPGTYFWNTVTASRGVCRLELRTAGAGPRFVPRALVQLLVSPSLGCGSARSFALGG